MSTLRERSGILHCSVRYMSGILHCRATRMVDACLSGYGRSRVLNFEGACASKNAMRLTARSNEKRILQRCKLPARVRTNHMPLDIEAAALTPKTAGSISISNCVNRQNIAISVFFFPSFFLFVFLCSHCLSPGGDIRLLFCLVLGPVNRRENWKTRERRGENLDNQVVHGLIIKFYSSLMSTMPPLYSQS
jgi:hypothetical protein